MTRSTRGDFWLLLLVCLKMFFRKTTRKRFVFLVAGAMLLMGTNTFHYVSRFRATELRMDELLADKSMQVFFVRCRNPADIAGIVRRHRKPLQAAGGRIVDEAFLYQNNLYLEWTAPAAHGGRRSVGLPVLYDLFGVRAAAEGFRSPSSEPSGYWAEIRMEYVDHNGRNLPGSTRMERDHMLKRDLRDLSDMIRGDLSGKRFEAFQTVSGSLIRSFGPADRLAASPPDPFLSRVDLVVPLNFLHILANLRNDTTTDVFDLAGAVRKGKAGQLAVPKAFLRSPDPEADLPWYTAVPAYPRYLPVVNDRLLSSRWSWMLVRQIALEEAFMSTLRELHFSGRFLFSYEKSHVLRERVEQINRDIRSNQSRFYLTDLCLGILFPFMVSLFAVVHLKGEFAFLLMFKNHVRRLLTIFWVLPLALVLLVKASTAAAALLPHSASWTSAQGILLPMGISYLLSAAVFYPLNRWCFGPFTGKRLNLYALQKGR